MGEMWSVVIAGIGAGGAVIASFFTANATASKRISHVEKDVAVLTERQDNHYKEIKDLLERVEGKVDEAL